MSSLETFMESQMTHITLCPSCRSLQRAWALCPVCRTYVVPGADAGEAEVVLPRQPKSQEPGSGFIVRLPRLRAVKS